MPYGEYDPTRTPNNIVVSWQEWFYESGYSKESPVVVEKNTIYGCPVSWKTKSKEQIGGGREYGRLQYWNARYKSPYLDVNQTNYARVFLSNKMNPAAPLVLDSVIRIDNINWGEQCSQIQAEEVKKTTGIYTGNIAAKHNKKISFLTFSGAAPMIKPSELQQYSIAFYGRDTIDRSSYIKLAYIDRGFIAHVPGL